MTKRRPKDIGTDAERPVARYLAMNGWPSAEARRTHGTFDLGDITGTPALAFEVKGGHQAEQASDADILSWLNETEAERYNAHADIGVLVWKRKGKGPSSVGQWWAALPGWAFVRLAVEMSDPSLSYLPPVRMLFSDVVNLLRTAGYGDPLVDTVPEAM
jgi:hypothetical protein